MSSSTSRLTMVRWRQLERSAPANRPTGELRPPAGWPLGQHILHVRALPGSPARKDEVETTADRVHQ